LNIIGLVKKYKKLYNIYGEVSMKKKVIIVVSIILIVVLASLAYLFFKKDTLTDAERFSKEYTEVGIDNVFVYRDIDEIINILENGTGIVYLGFPECPWCQKYVVYLNEVAKSMGVEKIYYFNILEDRKNNTEEYKKIVSILSEELDYDEEGNKRVFVPDVTFVVKGEIVGHDNETSQVTEEDGTPDEYWDEEKISFLKTRLSGLINNVQGNACNSCD